MATPNANLLWKKLRQYEIIKSRDEQNADWDLTDLKYALCTTNIEWVYNAVVKFIKDYNDGKN